MAKNFDDFITLVNEQGLSEVQKDKIQDLIESRMNADGGMDMQALACAIRDISVQEMLFHLRRYHEWVNS
jgi:hypothetical protein